MNTVIDEKNAIIMKLIHYFITEKNYVPIVLQGLDNEIWLENLNEDYKIVRIASNYIHNDEQLQFDLFKTRKLVAKIRKKTLSWKLNVLSIFTDIGENVNKDSLDIGNDIKCVNLTTYEENKDNTKYLYDIYPDMKDKLVFNEEGVSLFLKITNEINEKNNEVAVQAEDVFAPKKPIITYILIAINVLVFLMMIFGDYDKIVYYFGVNRYFITEEMEIYRLVTGAFLHSSILHLLFNCYALYVIGGQVESYFGKIKYIIIYLSSAILASLLSIIFSLTFSIGASGAIFGLLGAIVYFGYHYRVYLSNVLKSQIIPLIVINLVIGFIYTGIDNAAHIGGLIGGFLIATSVGVKYKSTTSQMVNGIVLTLIFTLFLVYLAFIYL